MRVISNETPKIVFIDGEFTGEHARTTLISLGVVTLEGAELYLTLNDYAEEQVSDWVAANVLADIDPTGAVDSAQAYRLLDGFLSDYAAGQRLYVVSAGLLQDVVLMFELYHHACPEREYFHALHCLPGYLQHHAMIDLNTLFRVCGVDPAVDRAIFAGSRPGLRRHNALDDARVVRDCFLKLMKEEPVRALIAGISTGAQPALQR